MLEVDDIHTYREHSYIVQGASLKVASNETVAVLGRNGVGKTTMLRSIIGFTPPRRGRIAFGGCDIVGWPPQRISRRGIALVPQGRRLFGSLTVEETLSLASRSKRHASGSQAWSLSRVYDAYPHLLERRRHLAALLSGGEQQMLATARALVANPELILLDEPTEGLAPLLVRDLLSLLRDLKAGGTALLLVEQRVDFALALADRIYLMSKGRIVLETTPGALAADPQTRHRYLGV
ncbi:MAG TPA: ABC transporter ATP-binding protein [Stellaceae bacterium]|nr:ABC transporter ATP-binding protein [Stellaceae bacterium]